MTKSNLEAIPLIDKFSQWLIEQEKSDSTVETYKLVLTKFHEWLLRRGVKLGQLTKNDIQAYMIYLESD